MSKSNIIEKISTSTDKVVKVAVFISIVGMIIIITLQILSRVLFDALAWSEEASRYLLVWSTFLGATMAYKRGMHIAVTFAIELFPKNINKIFRLLSITLSMVFFLVVIKFGINYITMQNYQVSAALRIPMKYVYTVIPASFAIMFIHGVAAINDVFIENKGGIQ